VYAGVDPLTRRPVYLKATARTEKQAQVELGKLLGKASDGRRPESDATVAKLLEEYAQTAGWDLSTRESNLGYIRRTIRPALGSMQAVRCAGPIWSALSKAKTGSMPAWPSMPRAADIRSWLRRTWSTWRAVKASPESRIASRRLPVRQ
jgi:hypothetical protein